MTEQLELLDDDRPPWHLTDEVRRQGLEGIARARALLRREAPQADGARAAA